jgi:mono/diheme cytochrome c family protein
MTIMYGEWPRRTLFLLVVLLPACSQQMADQPYYRPFEPSPLFQDRLSARPLVHGTVPRGYLRDDSHYYLGEKEYTNKWAHAASIIASAQPSPLASLTLGQSANPVVDTFPMSQVVDGLQLHSLPDDQWMGAVLRRGQDRFNIFCAVCHDRTGGGKGMIVQRGYAQPPSFHTLRLRRAPVGHFYRVITQGYGAMPSYAVQVPPEDRWAVVAYVRALQLSQHASLADVQHILKRASEAKREEERLPEDIRKAAEGRGGVQ